MSIKDIKKEIKNKYRKMNQLTIIKGFHNYKGSIVDQIDDEIQIILLEIKELKLKK